jgi:Flp pilus assembly protein TadD
MTAKDTKMTATAVPAVADKPAPIKTAAVAAKPVGGTAVPTPAAPAGPGVASAVTRAPVLHAEGRQLLTEGKFQEAIDKLTEALKLDPDLSQAYNARGYARVRLKQYADAISDFGDAIRLNGSYANAYLNRSAAKAASGDKAGADADLLKARELAGVH